MMAFNCGAIVHINLESSIMIIYYITNQKNSKVISCQRKDSQHSFCYYSAIKKRLRFKMDSRFDVMGVENQKNTKK